MLLHRSIGLDRFNSMPRSKAIHALYECCGHTILAAKIADARPFSTHGELRSRVDEECALLAAEWLPPKVADRIAEMLGPVDGWPEYMP